MIRGIFRRIFVISAYCPDKSKEFSPVDLAPDMLVKGPKSRPRCALWPATLLEAS